jgi:hypothetical protein
MCTKELKIAIDNELIFPIDDTYKLVESMIDVEQNINTNLIRL